MEGEQCWIYKQVFGINQFNNCVAIILTIYKRIFAYLTFYSSKKSGCGYRKIIIIIIIAIFLLFTFVHFVAKLNRKISVFSFSINKEIVKIISKVHAYMWLNDKT